MHLKLRHILPALASLAAVLTLATIGVRGQSGAKNGEWTTYGGDLASTRYTPLDQINANNFNSLEEIGRASCRERVYVLV